MISKTLSYADVRTLLYFLATSNILLPSEFRIIELPFENWEKMYMSRSINRSYLVLYPEFRLMVFRILFSYGLITII
jgi:hypothetical protein